MKILGLIPARGGSKGIPGKNIKTLGNKPLLQFTTESAKSSRFLNRVILSSDNPEIISVAEKLDLEIPFIRPKELARDETPSIDVIIHALHHFQQKDINFDAVCLLQPTTPFRKEDLIDQAIEKFENENFDSLVSVRKVPDEFNPHWIFEEKNGSLHLATGEKEMIPRRQDLPTAYFRDGAVYLTKTEIILKQHSLYGKNIGFIENENGDHVNLDSRKDWEKAEAILKNRI